MGTSLKSKLFVQEVTITVLLLCLIFGVLFWDNLKLAKLWEIDWTAVGAMLSGASAIAAFRAAKAALQIDQLQAERVEEGRQRDARSMAIALHYELAELVNTIQVLVATDEKSPLVIMSRAELKDCSNRIRTPFLDRFVDSYSSFDGETAGRLVVVLSGAMSIRNALTPPGDGYELSSEESRDAFKSAVDLCRPLRAHILEVMRRLERYMREAGISGVPTADEIRDKLRL